MTAPGAVPDVRLVDVTKAFRDVLAVDSVSLDVGAGEFFSLLGPSGCGKTTTLRMIGGFELPRAGRIELRGRDVTNEPPDRRPTNMVFQSYALFPHLDVWENVAFGLRRRKVAGRELRARVDEMLEVVRLAGLGKRRPSQLSGGQQQRVALARALVNRPTVLLLDEPLGALDLKLRRELQLELKRVQSEVGITFVYVTHDQEEALTLSDRIAVMRAGRIEQTGTPEALYEQPATRFVADFIGTTNLLQGRVERTDPNASLVRLAGGEACLAATNGTPVGSSVELSVRPESIELRPSGESAASGGPDAPGALAARVESSAYLGAVVSYQLRTQGGLLLTAFAPTGGARHPNGTDLEIRWAPAAARVLAEARAISSEEAVT